MENLTGQTIDRYHILEKLGVGGMATVYKALDTRLERHVAVKVIRTEQIPPAQLSRMLKRFEREAKSLAKLNHPSIVNIYDYGEKDGTPYLVMEYLPGGSLKQRLGGPMPFAQAAGLLKPIAEALAYAHQHGVLHRDVKPANILIREDGKPMLTDFGIAKLMELEDGATLTGTGLGVGTPEYMAPEQWKGKTTYQSDIYSLGVVFYEMVTGQKPYAADTPSEVFLKQMTEPLPDPENYVSGLPANVKSFMQTALANNPDERLQDMGAFISGLEELINERKISPEVNSHQISDENSLDPDITTDQIRLSSTASDKGSGRSKKWILAIVSAAFTILIGVGIILWRNTPEKQSDPAASGIDISNQVASTIESSPTAPEPTATQTKTAIPSPTSTPAPQLPPEVSAQFTDAVLPDQEAVISPPQFSQSMDAFNTPINPSDEFTAPVNNSIYATFSFDNLQEGGQLTALWYRLEDNELVNIDIHSWGSATGGYGFSECAISPDEWLPGEYEVQLFAGSTWKAAQTFTITGQAPAAAPTRQPISLENIDQISNLLKMDGSGSPVNGLAFSPQGDKIAAAFDDGTLAIYNTTSGALLRSYDAHQAAAKGVDFDPTGTLLVSGSFDKTVKIWNLDSSEPLHTIVTGGQIMAVSVAPEGDRVASIATSGEIKEWSLQSAELMEESHVPRRDQRSTGPILDISISSDWQTWAAGMGGTDIVAWRYGNALYDIELFTGSYSEDVHLGNVSISNDGALMISSALNRISSESFIGVFKVIRIKDKTVLSEIEIGQDYRGNDVQFSHQDDILFATYGTDLRAWDFENRKQLQDLEGHPSAVLRIAVSEDGALLASGDYSGNIILWGIP